MFAGGLPPLVEACCGMGDGDWAGEGTLGLLEIAMGAEPATTWGVLCEAAGEPEMSPNLTLRPPGRPPTGPPLAMYVTEAARA